MSDLRKVSEFSYHSLAIPCVWSLWKIPFYSLERKRVKMQIMSDYYYENSLDLREAGTTLWEPPISGERTGHAWLGPSILVSVLPAVLLCSLGWRGGLSQCGLGFEKSFIAGTPHLCFPTSPSGVKMEFSSSSAWFLCFSLSYLWTWWEWELKHQEHGTLSHLRGPQTAAKDGKFKLTWQSTNQKVGGVFDHFQVTLDIHSSEEQVFWKST